jgi:hypothetical protein
LCWVKITHAISLVENLQQKETKEGGGGCKTKKLEHVKQEKFAIVPKSSTNNEK